MTIFIAIVFFHWLGDFIFQSDQMATNKSKNNKWLLLHVVAYTGSFSGFLLLQEYSISSLLIWWLGNGVVHFIVDYITSRLTSYLWKAQDRHNFFVTIGFDQMIHLLTLVLSFNYVVHRILV